MVNKMHFSIKLVGMLMFMLHFMDYSKEGDFNHGLIILFAILTLALSITGLIWLFELIKRRQFNFDQT